MAKGHCSLVGALSLVVFISRQSLSGEAVRPRGVKPDLASFYDPSRDFQCLDGSATIKFTQVNDDYCDCRDGSDEPGTSACPNSNFYCANRGFKPTLVYSSRVNDGICDCCDGSDEWALDNPCANTCDELGAAERLEAERLAKLAEEGLRLKAELIQRGKDLKQQRLNDIEAKKAQKEAAFNEKEAKKVTKEQAEVPEREALDKIHAEEERLQQIKKTEQKLENERKALEFFYKMDSDQNGEVTKEEMVKEIRFDQNNDGIISDDEAAFYLSGHDSYNKDSFLDIGWPLMSHLFLEKSSDVKGDGSDDGDAKHDDELDDYDYDHDKDDGDHQDNDDTATTEAPSTPSPEEEAAKPSKYDEATQALVDAANAARAEYDAADRTYRDLEREVQDLEKKLETDYGQEEEYSTLANQCFEYSDLEYTYKLCVFDLASQRQKSGGSETRLGNWDRWSGPDSDLYSQMSYTRGVQCWNGPQRSAKVNLKCGANNQLTAVSEPSRCEYEFVFETPAACKKIEIVSHDHDEL